MVMKVLGQRKKIQVKRHHFRLVLLLVSCALTPSDVIVPLLIKQDVQLNNEGSMRPLFQTHRSETHGAYLLYHFHSCLSSHCAPFFTHHLKLDNIFPYFELLPILINYTLFLYSIALSDMP